MSMKTSMKARGSFGSVGSPGLGSSDDAHGTDRRQTAIPPGDGQLHVPSFTPGIMVVKTLGSKPVVSSKIILEQLVGTIGFVEHL